jgi:hypothetical protein
VIWILTRLRDARCDTIKNVAWVGRSREFSVCGFDAPDELGEQIARELNGQLLPAMPADAQDLTAFCDNPPFRPGDDVVEVEPPLSGPMDRVGQYQPKPRRLNRGRTRPEPPRQPDFPLARIGRYPVEE